MYEYLEANSEDPNKTPLSVASEKKTEDKTLTKPYEDFYSCL